MPRQVNYTQSSYTVASSPGHSQILSERFFNSYYSKVMMLLCFTSCQVNRFNYAQTLYTVASFPGHFQILSCSCGEIFYTAARQNLVSQLWRQILNGCETKSGSGLGMKLHVLYNQVLTLPVAGIQGMFRPISPLCRMKFEYLSSMTLVGHDPKLTAL